jgi:hypothetical protein
MKAQNLFNDAVEYLTHNEADERQRADVIKFLNETVQRYGPVVESYPTWHPLVSGNGAEDETCPGEESGYKGLDHTIYFVNAFITCPYGDGVEDVKQSVSKLDCDQVFGIECEELGDIVLYHTWAHPIIVTCEWNTPINSDRTIPARLAIPLMLENELKNWRRASHPEPWGRLNRYLLGDPCTKTTSLFVNGKTGCALKATYESLNRNGVFNGL